jgi:DNA-binding response OmpR family regulator
MSGTSGERTVLVVDDEPEVAEMVRLVLQREYTVHTVNGGEAALEAVDEDIDVVLLDRRMPDLSGDEVLSSIRDRGLDCRVIMLSAVLPDYDVLDMPLDDYVTKPVAGDTLLDAVERQIKTLGDETLAEYLGIVAKRSLLEESRPASELEEHEGYRELVARAEELSENVDVEVDTDASVVPDIDRT